MSRPFADSDVFRAIADPTRRRIIDLLLQHDRSAAALVQAVSISGPSISRHLGVLRRTGIVSARRSGRGLMYHLHQSVLTDATSWLQRCAATKGAKRG